MTITKVTVMLHSGPPADEFLHTKGLCQSRYIGLARTALQHILIAVALTLVRLVAWWEEQPLAPTRISTFGALASRLGTRPAYPVSHI
jgi:hypothetical protein